MILLIELISELSNPGQKLQLFCHLLYEFYQYFPLKLVYKRKPKWIVKPKDARYKQLKEILNVMPGDEKYINNYYPIPPRTKQEIKEDLEWKLKRNADMFKN